MANRLMQVLCGMSVLLSVSLSAETLVDPTRPPAEIANTAVSSASQVAVTPAAGLQSILISKTRRAAIIDGKTFELGQSYGDAKLVEINESSVVLVSSQGRRELRLFPAVNITQKGEKLTPKLPPVGVQADQNNNPPVKHKEQK